MLRLIVEETNNDVAVLFIGFIPIESQRSGPRVGLEN